MYQSQFVTDNEFEVNVNSVMESSPKPSMNEINFVPKDVNKGLSRFFIQSSRIN